MVKWKNKKESAAIGALDGTAFTDIDLEKPLEYEDEDQIEGREEQFQQCTVLVKNIEMGPEPKGLMNKIVDLAAETAKKKYKLQNIPDPGVIHVEQVVKPRDMTAPIEGKVHTLSERAPEILIEEQDPSQYYAESYEEKGIDFEELDQLAAKEPQVYELQVAPPPDIVVHSDPEVAFETKSYALKNPIIATRAEPPTSSLDPCAVVEPAPLSQYQLLVTAVEARNLAQMQRFGTQTPFLELKVGPEGKIVKTFRHKKGGSAAQWNQNFILVVPDLELPLIIVARNSHGIIGQTALVCSEIGDGHRDEFFSIHNPKTGEETGQVRLQLRLVDRDASEAAISPLPLDAVTKPPTPAPACDVIQDFLRKGGLLIKVPCHSTSLPKRQWFTVEEGGLNFGLKADGALILWCDPNCSTSQSHFMRLRDVESIKRGHKTKAFYQQLTNASKLKPTTMHEDLCFSLITPKRTLDIVASSKIEADRWVDALAGLIYGPESSKSLNSAREMEEYRQAALTPREPASSTPVRSQSIDFAGRQKEWMRNIFDYARANSILEISRYLSEGCPVDIMESGSGDTVLMIACRSGHVDLVELCLKWRAKNDPHPQFGETALQVAVIAQQTACVALLLSTAADSKMDTEIVNHADPRNDAPIHIAAAAGDIACLELLIHHGADITLVDALGRTSLHCAALKDQYEVCALLMDVGGDTILDSGDHKGNTALHYAAMIGSVKIVQLLLQSAANVYAVNEDEDQASDVARAHSQLRAMELILEYQSTSVGEKAFSRCLKPGEVPSDDEGNEEDMNEVAIPPPPQPVSRPRVVARLDMDAVAKKRYRKKVAQMEFPHSARGVTAEASFRQTQRSSRRRSASFNYYDQPSEYSSPQQYHEYSYGYDAYRGWGTSPQTSAVSQIRDALSQRSYYSPRGPHSASLPSSPYGYYNSREEYGCYDGGYYSPHSSHYDNANYQDPNYYDAHYTASSSREEYYPNYPTFSHLNVEWQILTTENGDQYFVNQSTMESQWEDPRTQALSPPKTPTKEAALSPSHLIRSQLQVIRASVEERDDDKKSAFREQHALSLEVNSEEKESSPKQVYSRMQAAGVPVDSIEKKMRADGVPEEEIDEFFAASSSFTKSRKSSPRSKTKFISLISPKRSNQLALALSQFKTFDSIQDLLVAIQHQDSSDLSLDLLKHLEPLLPTPDEQAKVLKYDGLPEKLGKAEQFLYALVRIPQFPDLLQYLLFQLQFPQQLAQLDTQIQQICKGCQIVLNSPFGKCLKKFVSQEEEKLTLSFLLQAANGEMLGDELELKEPAEELLESLEQASEHPTTMIMKQIKQLEKQLQEIQKQVQQQKAKPADERDFQSSAMYRLTQFCQQKKLDVQHVNEKWDKLMILTQRLATFFNENPQTCDPCRVFLGLVEFLQQYQRKS